LDTYREIAEKLALPGRDEAKFDIRKLVRVRLESRESGKWLIILGNADIVRCFIHNIRNH
jgi:hypothetical protein